MGIAFLIMRERGAMGITEKLDLRIVSLPLEGNAIKLSKILIAHVGNSVCFFHAFFLKVNNKTKKLIKECLTKV